MHHADVEKIPEAQLPLLADTISQKLYQKVFCDIETSSLHYETDILQISAVCKDDFFNQYITPTKKVSPAAAAVTGLTAQGSVLFHNGSPANTLSLSSAMQLFISWLDDRAPVVLIGHTFHIFDFPMIVRAIHISNLKAPFQEKVVGAVDTLPIFKEIRPDQQSYKQVALVENILQEQYQAHDALAGICSSPTKAISSLSGVE